MPSDESDHHATRRNIRCLTMDGAAPAQMDWAAIESCRNALTAAEIP
jgi:hypothetical protein